MTKLKSMEAPLSPSSEKAAYMKPSITILHLEEEHSLLAGSPAVTPGSSPITVTPPTPEPPEEKTGEDGTW